MLTNCRISNAAVGFDVSQVKISSIRPKSRIHNSFLKKKKRNTDVLSTFFLINVKMTTFGVTSLGVDKPSRNLDRLNMTMDTNFFSVEFFFVYFCAHH